MKKCPYCAEEIQDAAIVCRYCGKDIQDTEKHKPNNQILKIVLHPIFIILVMYFVMSQLDIKLGNTGSTLFCGFWLVVILVASNARQKLMTKAEQQHEQEEADYWAGRGH